ncbi:hypothetical protein PIB30_101861, partial [Stylosanthes scabra]|nr:hypothetical protein [Stylosanthes scabra]MED6165669.1 hypothetical protein [Stylosanthes scabra]
GSYWGRKNSAERVSPVVGSIIADADDDVTMPTATQTDGRSWCVVPKMSPVVRRMRDSADAEKWPKE